MPYKFEAGTPNIAGAVGLGAALDYVDKIGLEAIAAHEHQLMRFATQCLGDIPGVRIIGTAADKAAALSFVVDDPPMSGLDVGTRLDLEGIAVRTGHHCCMPLMDRFGIPGTARASFAMYNTLDEVEMFAQALKSIVAEASSRSQPATLSPRQEPTYPPASAASPDAAADELVEMFDFLDNWQDRYHYLIEMGEKLLPMPDALKTEKNRVRGCQSTVYLWARAKARHARSWNSWPTATPTSCAGTGPAAKSLFRPTRGQGLGLRREGFMHRLGLDQNLSMGRRNGLGEMVQRIRNFAGEMLKMTPQNDAAWTPRRSEPSRLAQPYCRRNAPSHPCPSAATLPDGAVDDGGNTSLKNDIVAALCTCFDPEIPVNIYELGLIYDIEIAPTGAVAIRMTLTSPMCPAAGSLPGDVQRKVQAVPRITVCESGCRLGSALGQGSHVRGGQAPVGH